MDPIPVLLKTVSRRIFNNSFCHFAFNQACKLKFRLRGPLPVSVVSRPATRSSMKTAEAAVAQKEEVSSLNLNLGFWLAYNINKTSTKTGVVSQSILEPHAPSILLTV